MRVVLRTVLVLALAGAGAAVPGGAAQAAPDSHASCVGQVFQPQATGEPRAVALRIAEIKRDFLLPGEPFGRPISGLARDTWCRS